MESNIFTKQDLICFRMKYYKQEKFRIGLVVSKCISSKNKKLYKVLVENKLVFINTRLFEFKELNEIISGDL